MRFIYKLLAIDVPIPIAQLVYQIQLVVSRVSCGLVAFAKASLKPPSYALYSR
jgi:hypothetical protein